MMYSDKIVAAIKVNGRVLRENGDTVTLPFGAEYSILLKNLNSVRAQVSVSVDGKDATDGSKLIIAPNSSINIERFIKNGNLQAGNRFKFIERSSEVEAHRGIGEEDGLIRVEAWREYVRPFVPIPQYYPTYPPYPRWRRPQPFWGGGMRVARRPGPVMAKGARPQMRSLNTTYGASAGMEKERGDTGITVAGSESRQQFYASRGFEVEPNSAVIVLRLRGSVEGIPVAEPVTVDFKPTCTTCGKANPANSQFCGACGTALILV